jgi:hypothetical protein
LRSLVARLATCISILYLDGGCAHSAARADVRLPLQFSGLVVAGVRQAVSVSPSVPAPGDTILIRTVLRNETADTVSVEVTDDPMAEGTLVVRVPSDRIVFRSGGRRQIAPHDSLVTAFHGIVGSPPGVYVLRVRHATGGEPVNGLVTVRARVAGKPVAQPANDR